jgi:hypothetical protein
MENTMDKDGIFRVGTSTGNYHIVNNEPANDERLSWEARGIISYLLSKPDGWVCRNKDLENKGPAGRNKIKKCLKELQDLGYLTRFRENDDAGHFRWVTTVYESPSLNPTYGGTVSPSTENRAMVTMDPLTIDGSTIDGKQGHIVNTDKVITDKDKIFVPNGTTSDPEEEEPIKCIQCFQTIVENEGQLCTVCDQVVRILSSWANLFPKKTQPRPTTYRAKIKARMKSREFRKNWAKAMVEASKSPHLNASSWFQFRFFVNNNDNWRKCLEHYYESFDQQLAGKNGQGGSSAVVNTAWAKVSKAVIKYGRYKKPLFDDEQIAQAVSAMGWENVCNLPDGEGKRMFGEIFSSQQVKQIDDVLGSSW